MKDSPRLPAAPELPSSWRSPRPRLPWSLRHSATTSRWLTSFTTAIAISPCSTSSPRFGRARKALCCSGAGCCPPTDWFCVFATRWTPVLVAHASIIIAAVQIFFLMLVNFAAHPFALVAGAIPPDGNGLNPLLQYPEMVIHPPMLYLGYVGMTVPFAFALAALIIKYPGEKWIHITRRWTMVGWAFLTCGVFLGMHWAYAVLGWGGYWGWDPVENASILPWLTGTAFLHSVMMQEKRGMMKVWNMWLIFATFLLSIFGTFLTRSGVVSSVHAFAQSGIGPWFVAFLVAHFRRVRVLLRAQPFAPRRASTNWSRWYRANPVSCSTTCCCWSPASPCCGAPCSRCCRNGFRARRSPSGRRSSTRSTFPLPWFCLCSPESDRCWPGARRRWRV